MKNNSALVFLMVASSLALLYSCNKTPQNEWAISGPEKNITFILSLDPAGHLFYEVYIDPQKKVDLIQKSKLGLLLDDSLYNTFPLEFQQKSEVVTGIEDYQMLTGKQQSISDAFMEQTFYFKNPDGKNIGLQIRVFKNGVGFRYHLDLKDGDSLTVIGESTEFAVPKGLAWIQPYDKVTKWTPGYEKPFLSGIPTNTNSPHDEGWCFPILISYQDHWALITEAGLIGTYPATHLEPEAKDGVYQIRFPEKEEAEGLGVNTARIGGKWSSPWRLIIAGNELGSIVESNLVHSLSNSPELDNTEWVKPGIASWSWWSDHDSPQSTAQLRKFIDLSAGMEWRYSLIDANWNLIPEDSLQMLIKYAESKNVGLWLWYNSGGPHNTVEEQPRDRMHLVEARREELKKISTWGIKGIKIDFFQSDKQMIIEQYLGILKDAAENKILLNFHGATLPRGWQRTYPHLLTTEAVRGAETYSFNAEWPLQAPTQNTIYPFTRNVTGSMDYTPVTFSNHNHPRVTTLTHELALSIIFESAIQHFADTPEAYLNQISEVKRLLSNMPTVWEETKYLHGYPGKEVVLARKYGGYWYIGGINGENAEKTINVNLSDLALNNHDVDIFWDGENEIIHRTATIPKTKRLELTMAPYGGFVMQVKD